LLLLLLDAITTTTTSKQVGDNLSKMASLRSPAGK
jgi:hypothetical protein